jgi:hypothetical protein
MGVQNMKSLGLLLALCLVTFSVQITFAQDDTTCSTLVQTAYESTETACQNTDRDEACYGNISVVADPQPDAETFEFDSPGDVAGLSSIAGLRLSSMNAAADEWGLSLMRLQASLAEGGDEFVEVLLFGNVELEDASQDTSEFGAMQAFYFRSGMDDRPCEAAPDSGILIQTPEGVGEITLLVNEVVIDLGSTAYLQAEAGNQMVISVVEGEGTVTAFETSVSVPAGTSVSVPLDENGVASGAPQAAQAYDDAELESLPIELLAEEISIAPALEQESAGVPIVGEWSLYFEKCDYNPNPATYFSRVELDGDTMLIPFGFEKDNYESAFGTLVQSEPGVYFQDSRETAGEFWTETTIEVLAPDHMKGTMHNTWGTCWFEMNLTQAD